MGLETIVQVLNPAASGSSTPSFSSLRRALESLGNALRKGTQGSDAQALHDVQAAAGAEVWDGLWAGGQSLPFWSRPTYARYRDEIQSLLRDLRNPVEEITPAKCGRQLERITPLLNGLDQWEERSRRAESWWRGIKSVAFLGAGVFGTVAYFLMRAVGDLEVDAVTMLCPAPAPADLTRDSKERTRFLANYSAYFFGQPNTALPLFEQGITKTTVVPVTAGQGNIAGLTETERRLQSVLTPSQNVYDWLAQGDPEGRFVFSARLVNRSSRGARFVKTLTTRLTLLESIDIPWNDLPVTPALDCRLDLNARTIVIHNQPGPPALKVRWRLNNGETEVAAGDNTPVLLSNGKTPVSLRRMRQLSLMEFLPVTQQHPEERITPSDRRSLRLSERPAVGDEPEVSSLADAPRRDLPYWKAGKLPFANQDDIYFETPRTRQELAAACNLTQELRLIVECEDLRGQPHSQEFQLLLPANWTFAIPNRGTAGQGWETAPSAQGSEESKGAAAAAAAAARWVAAAKDTAEPPTNRQEQPFLFAVLGCPGSSLVPGAAVEHRSEFNTYLSAEGIILLSGTVWDAPAGRYQIEILSNDTPMTRQELVVFPMSKFLSPVGEPSEMNPLLPSQTRAARFREAVDRFRKHCGLGPTDARIKDSRAFGGVFDPRDSSMNNSQPSRHQDHFVPTSESPAAPAPAAPAPAGPAPAAPAPAGPAPAPAAP